MNRGNLLIIVLPIFAVVGIVIAFSMQKNAEATGWAAIVLCICLLVWAANLDLRGKQ